MKERSLLYFVTSVVASILLLVSIIIRTQDWFSTYGYIAMPTMYELFIPVVLLWVGWYFDIKGFLLSSSIIYAVLLGMHFDHAGVLNGRIFVISIYAPLVKTSFVLGVILLLGTSVLGFYTYLKMHLVNQS